MSKTQQGGAAQTNTEAVAKREAQEKRLKERMADIENTVVVLSGKGGVGKSTVAVNLALALTRAGKKAGLLDADMHGPSAPGMLNLEGAPIRSEDGEIMLPADHPSGLKVMSIDFLLRERNDPVIWRGPMKMNALRQFISDVEWGDLDYLVVDLPPGTGDEPLSICQLIPEATGGVVVTTPQEVALSNVRKCVNFCRQIDLPVLGVVENMSGFICPHCGEQSDIFGWGGGEEMANEMEVPFLGRIPLDIGMVEAGDRGEDYFENHGDSRVARSFQTVVDAILSNEKGD